MAVYSVCPCVQHSLCGGVGVTQLPSRARLLRMGQGLRWVQRLPQTPSPHGLSVLHLILYHGAFSTDFSSPEIQRRFLTLVVSYGWPTLGTEAVGLSAFTIAFAPDQILEIGDQNVCVSLFMRATEHQVSARSTQTLSERVPGMTQRTLAQAGLELSW